MNYYFTVWIGKIPIAYTIPVPEGKKYNLDNAMDALYSVLYKTYPVGTYIKVRFDGLDFVLKK